MGIKVREIEKMISSDFIVLVKPDNTVVATNNKVVADSANLEDMHNDNWLDYEIVRIESCCFTRADYLGNEVTKIGVCLIINEINPEAWMDKSVSNVWPLIGRENNVRLMENDTELVCGKKKDGYSSFGLRTVGRIFASEDFNDGEHGLVLYLENE